MIGKPYLARTWYANTRVGIGKGKPALVPSNLAGSLIIDRDGYQILDLKDKVMKKSAVAQKGDGLNTIGDDALTSLHMQNFLDSIRTGAKLNLCIEDGAKTGLLCHLGTRHEA